MSTDGLSMSMETDDLEALRQRVEHDPRLERRSAEVVLGSRGDPHAAVSLCQALGDAHLREIAGAALVQLGEAAVLPLCAALKDRDWRVRTQAAEVLVRIGDPRAVLPLIAALKGHGWESAMQIARALGERGDARAVLPLCEALRAWHIEAAVALGEMAARKPVPEVKAALPLLRERLRFLASGAANTEVTQIYRNPLERIEAATASMNDLPIPASAPLPSAEELPVPCGPAPTAAEDLPLPSRG
jgi:HEAT repeat protein